MSLGKEIRPGLVLCTGGHQGSLGTRLALGLYSTLVLTRGAWERGKPWACSLYWCSPGAPGKEASHELALLTGAHQESLATWLAMSPYWCSSWDPGNKASPGIVLHTGAHLGSLGTRLACIRGHQGSLECGYPWACTQHWCSPEEPGNEARPGFVLHTCAHEGSLGTRQT